MDPALYVLKTRNIVTRLNPDRINMDLILEILQLIDSSAQFSDVTGAAHGLARLHSLYGIDTDKMVEEGIVEAAKIAGGTSGTSVRKLDCEIMNLFLRSHFDHYVL